MGLGGALGCCLSSSFQDSPSTKKRTVTRAKEIHLFGGDGSRREVHQQQGGKLPLTEGALHDSLQQRLNEQMQHPAVLLPLLHTRDGVIIIIFVGYDVWVRS